MVKTSHLSDAKCAVVFATMKAVLKVDHILTIKTCNNNEKTKIIFALSN